jgi:hypothetical protein
LRTSFGEESPLYHSQAEWRFSVTSHLGIKMVFRYGNKIRL